MSTSSPLADASDADLIRRTRAGSEDAYAELFTRHRGIALGVARRVAGPDHAEDLVADAFLKVLAVLRNGGGPDDAFRGYLLTTVRNLHLNKIRSTRRESLVPDYEDVERHLVVGDGVDDLLDSHAVGRAFAALPERWQTVLWLGAVEGRPNDEIARLLDLTPNAVAALSFRARDGLREAYLADHLLDAQDRGCRRFTDLMPAYVRGNLTRPRQTLVTEHLDGCVRCAGLVAELSLVEANLAAYLAPLLFVPLVGQAVVGSGTGSGAVAWFAKLGAFGKAAVLTATVGPVLTATVVTGAALRADGPPEPSSRAGVEQRVAPGSASPVRRPAKADPATAVGSARPAAVVVLDEVPGEAPVDETPAAAAEPAGTSAPVAPVDPPRDAQPGPGTDSPAATADRSARAPSGRLLRRLLARALRIAEPVVDATTDTAALLSGTDLLGASLGLLGTDEPVDRR